MLLDLHAVGLERAIEVIAKNGDTGLRVIDELGRDPLVGSLLILYGIHPLDIESRITQAVEKVQPRVRKGGGELALLSFKNGAVRLQLQVKGHGCGSTRTTLKAMVEDALYEAAPDLNQLLIEGLDEDEPNGASGFVPLGKLGSAVAPAPVMSGT